MKFDNAYCLSLDEKLSIYDVRDLNFDETQAFDSAQEHFLCPDDACRAALGPDSRLGTYNAKNVRFKKTPHFKDRPSTRHLPECRYFSAEKAAAAPDGGDGREDNFPSELLLTRRTYQRAPAVVDGAAPAPQLGGPVLAEAVSAPTAARRPAASPAPLNRTTIFAHPVECFVSNYADKERLKSHPLKIADQALNYWSFFKKIEYCQDKPGLIYWGKVKAIKSYKTSFSIQFANPLWLDKKRYPVNVYLSKSLIENYRQRRVFLEEIEHAMDQTEDLYCFFYGVTPQRKEVPGKTDPQRTFSVFSAEIENLDHFILRTAPGLTPS